MSFFYPLGGVGGELDFCRDMTIILSFLTYSVAVRLFKFATKSNNFRHYVYLSTCIVLRLEKSFFYFLASYLVSVDCKKNLCTGSILANKNVVLSHMLVIYAFYFICF